MIVNRLVLLGLWLVLLCLHSIAAVASVRTFVDPKVLDETETLRLTLRLEGTQRAGAPDLSALETDFEVLGQTSSSQYRSINGQVQAWVEYQINLRPLRTGTLTIPALALDGQYSDPTQVQVRALDPVLRQEIDRMVFFEVEVSPDPVYVQAEIKVVRRLFYATSGGVQMYSELPGAPELADAVVIPLSNAESLRAKRNDIDYNVVEQRFAVYPEQSGPITIPAVSLTSSVRVLKDGRMRRSGIRVSSEAKIVNVLPIPSEYPADAPWLPATNVELSQALSPLDDLQTGVPITRTLRAQVSGNVSSAISPLTSQSRANADSTVANGFFREYPQAPETSDVVRGESNVGSREEQSSLLPLKPGRVELAAQELIWWDTLHHQVRSAKAEPVALAISGSAVATESSVAAAEQPTSNTVAASQPPEPSLVTPVEPLRHWRWFALVALLAALVIGWRQLPKPLPLLHALTKRLGNTTLNNAGIRQRLAAELKRVGSDPVARRSALLTAVAECRVGSKVDAAKRLAQHNVSATVITALDTLCYGAGQGSSAPNDAAIMAAFDACVVKQTPRPASALPPLYPSRRNSSS